MAEGAGLIGQLLSGGFDDLLSGAHHRRKVADALPREISEHLARNESRSEALATAEALVNTHWPALMNARGRIWAHGWAEIVGATAVVVELACGTLPERVHRAIVGTPAEAEWSCRREPFQRFALTVGESAAVRRMHVVGKAWSMDGPPVTGRSHTLLLELLREGALNDLSAPVAASGVVGADGQVSQVQRLPEKAAAWWAHQPRGVLITAPPGIDFPVLVDAFRPGYHREGSDAEPEWVVASTIAELKAKLSATPLRVSGWDGAQISAGAVRAVSRLTTGARSAEPLDTPRKASKLERAAFSASSSSSPKGVLITGCPGSGKSVLSQAIEERFNRSPLGAFGYGVRVRARDLVAHLDADTDWLQVSVEVLGLTEDLAGALLSTRRLVPIVDGLDELSPKSLRASLRFLDELPGWWIATTRPHESVLRHLPECIRLQIPDLTTSEADALLTDRGREDLTSTQRDAAFSAQLLALLRTPLLVSLLVGVVSSASELEHLTANRLYERAYDQMLEHACISNRMTDERALQLKGMVPLVGELAMRWLRDEAGLLSRRAAHDALTSAGIPAGNQGALLEALCFGHLLYPLPDGWEFGHRALAEWSAAHAIAARVRNVESREEEVRELSPFLAGPTFPGETRWKQLLEFYAPLARWPLTVVERLLGPEQVGAWRASERDWESHATITRPLKVSEALKLWTWTFEWAASASWSDEDPATRLWTIAVRRWLLADLGEGEYERDSALPLLARVAQAVCAHLPRDLSDLVALAAADETQFACLEQDPMLLLPAIPSTHTAAVEELLETGSRSDHVQIASWYRDREVAPPASWLQSLVEEIPRELSQRTVDTSECAERSLRDLESLAWELLFDMGSEPRWTSIAAAWRRDPWHLQKHLRGWMHRQPAEFESDVWFSRRRELLAITIERVVNSIRDIEQTLSSLAEETRQDVIAGVHYRFSDKEDRYLRSTLKSVTEPRGRSGASASGAQQRTDSAPEVAKVESCVRRLNGARSDLSSVVSHFPPGSALGQVVGVVWENSADEVVKAELLKAVGDRVPAEIPARFVLQSRPDEWALRRVQWLDLHLEQLRVLSKSGNAELRLKAIRVHADHSKRDLVSAVSDHLPSADEEFQRLAYALLESHHVPENVPVPEPARLSMRDRASRGVSGWTLELLSELAIAEPATLESLAELAAEHQVREAISVLVDRLPTAGHGTLSVCRALATLSVPTSDARRQAARVALQHGWLAISEWSDDKGEEERLASELADELQVADIGLIVDGTVSIVKHPSLAHAVRRLAPLAVEQIREGVRTTRVARAVLQANSDDDHSYERREQLRVARSNEWGAVENLFEAVRMDHLSIETTVGLVMEALGGDTHHVWSTPGPLGSDFEGLGDQDWESKHENLSQVKQAEALVRSALEDEPGSWESLLPLLSHPSETLLLRVFEMCADHAEAHQIAQLGIAAIRGYARRSLTTWSGNTMGLLAGALEPGAGANWVEVPRTSETLERAVRERLTRLDRDLIEGISRDEQPYFRRLSARWAEELGDRGWAEFVTPLVRDRDVAVAATAIDALAVLAPGTLNRTVGEALQHNPQPGFDQMLIRKLLPLADDASMLGRQPRPGLRQLVSAETVFRLLKTAAERDGAGSRSSFLRSPSLVEQLLDADAALRDSVVSELASDWRASDDVHVRSVGHRLQARAGNMAADETEMLLNAPSVRERFCGIECALLGGHAEFCGLIAQMVAPFLDWREVPRDAYEAWGEEYPEDESYMALSSLRTAIEEDGPALFRFCRAMTHAPVGFHPLLSILPNPIYWESGLGIQADESEEAERLVVECLRRWVPDGSLRILELMDDGELGDCYRFVNSLRDLSLESTEFRREVRERAERGGQVSKQVAAATDKWLHEHDIDGLAEALRGTVFVRDH